MVRLSLDNPAYYINREQSWLNFDRRVLEEAQDERNPLLERVKFLSISANNLDEFFEIRVAGLLQQIEDGYSEPAADGLLPEAELEKVALASHAFVDEQYRCWNQTLQPQLAAENIRVIGMDSLDEESREAVSLFYDREVDPLLTPVTIDPAHPFPRVINKALCLAFLMRRRRRAAQPFMGVVTVPRSLPRLVRLPSEDGASYIFLHELVADKASRLYRGYEIISAAGFRVTRNSNLYMQDEDSRNLMESVRAELHNRRKGDAVRLEIEADANEEIIDRLRVNFGLERWQVYRNEGPVNLSRLFQLHTEVQRPELKYRPFVSRTFHLQTKSRDFFEEVRQRDVLLHHPFDSYEPVINFIESAAQDPNVLSVKQTLYRTNEDSPIIEALMDAAPNREVTVVVELKARFDEASNIKFARNMEDAGVQVFHGLVGLKTHCKLALLARRDPDGIVRRYAHLGSGNYNPVTANFYTDLSLFTADEEITSAVQNVFNFITANSDRPDYKPLLVSPVDLPAGCMSLIEREAQHARHRRPARIIAKMNGLLDKSMIQALYRASQAGVEIDLLVRGMCALRPGIRGVSDKIKVRSVVGRLLEHSRIFYFHNAGDEEVYVSSADWMARNLYERVEVMFPIKDPGHRQRIVDEILASYLADDIKARILQKDGTYARAKTTRAGTAPSKGFDAQEFLIALAEGKKTRDQIPKAPSKRARPKAAPRLRRLA